MTAGKCSRSLKASEVYIEKCHSRYQLLLFELISTVFLLQMLNSAPPHLSASNFNPDNSYSVNM